MPNSPDFNRAVEQVGKTWTLNVTGDTDAADRPDYINDLCERQLADVELVRDVYAGTGHMRRCREKYLPKHAAEEPDDYDRRLKRATLFNAVRRTAHGLVGMIFKEDPILEGVPDQVREHLENIDLAGRDISVFAKDIAKDVVLDGHAVILVDHPPALTDEQGRTTGEFYGGLAVERAVRLRPYWVQIKKQDILNVQWEVRNGAPFLTLFVCRETVTRPKGMFGEETVERFRVLRPGSVEVWEREVENNAERFVLVEESRTSLSYIPVVPVHANQTGFFESTPPLLDLAYENIDHWVNRNEHKMSLARARIPMPVFINTQEDGGVKWGSNYSIRLTGEGADAKMLESTGAALDASRDDLKDTALNMAALGLSMLVRETRAAETAEGKRIDRAESDSQLATIARGLQDALDMALWMHADYLRIDRDRVGHIEINRDFTDTEMSPQMLQVLLAACQANKISVDTLWSIMQAGKVLPEDFDPDIERDALESQTAESLAAVRAMMQEPAELDDAA